jgi:hypothetical protein
MIVSTLYWFLDSFFTVQGGQMEAERNGSLAILSPECQEILIHWVEILGVTNASTKKLAISAYHILPTIGD